MVAIRIEHIFIDAWISSAQPSTELLGEDPVAQALGLANLPG
jgi:hypothetical protein